MRRTLGLALAAGLLALLPTSTARAQAPYGYDSWYYNLPAAAPIWYSAGYSGVYTDQSTASFITPEVAPFRGVAPYAPPPFGAFAQTDGLVAPPPQPVIVQPQAQAPNVRVQRRGLLGRLRARR